MVARSSPEREWPHAYATSDVLQAGALPLPMGVLVTVGQSPASLAPGRAPHSRPELTVDPLAAHLELQQRIGQGDDAAHMCFR